MDGKELLERVVSTIQEMYLKLGDPEGAVSLYYPFEGDYPNLESEFYSEISGRYPGITVEMMSNRLRVLIPEEDCIRISAIPAKPTMKDLVDLTMARRKINDYREHLGHKYPGSRIIPSPYIDFDWILVFPEEIDKDIYCLSEELGTVTFHRFSKEEYTDMGFRLP